MQALDCDFYVFSGHKICGPTGIGIYTERRMNKQTSSLPRRWRNDQGSFLRKTTYAELPHKFEAGTPNIAAGIVLGTAVDYMNEVALITYNFKNSNY
jgi:cysteine desulfurase/selenocysteine lyase